MKRKKKKIFHIFFSNLFSINNWQDFNCRHYYFMPFSISFSVMRYNKNERMKGKNLPFILSAFFLILIDFWCGCNLQIHMQDEQKWHKTKVHKKQITAFSCPPTLLHSHTFFFIPLFLSSSSYNIHFYCFYSCNRAEFSSPSIKHFYFSSNISKAVLKWNHLQNCWTLKEIINRESEK